MPLRRGKLKRAAIDAWMYSETGWGWEVRGDVYQVIGDSRSKVTRPGQDGEGGGDWSGPVMIWINQRDQRFGTYQAIASKDPHEQAVFGLSSNGLKTNRDAWCYNFDEDELRRNIHAHVDYLNAERERVYRAISNGADKSAELKCPRFCSV